MRTEKSIINLITGIFSIFLISFGKFFTTKIFIEKLGADLNGLYQIFIQISAYLSLAEGGMGTSLIFILYTPLSEKNTSKINELLSAAKKIYRHIGLGIFFISIPLSLKLNFFINTSLNKKELSLLFMLYIFRISIDYFTNISRFLFQADQKEYRINLITTIIKVLDLILQYLLLVYNFSLYFIFVKDILVIFFINLIIENKVKKEYTWLNLNNKTLDYSFIKNMKYLLIHTLCSAIVYNTDYILLGKFKTLTDVTLYSNYLMLINFSLSIPLKGINSIGASIGNLLNENNLKKTKQIFLELFNITFYIASLSGVILYFTISDFIELWLGKKFILDNISIIILIILYLHSLIRQPAGILVNSAGLFKETQNSVILEMSLNLILSLFMVKKYGIRGVLLGTLLAHLFSNFWYYPFICYKFVLKDKIKKYFSLFFQNLFELVILFLVIKFLLDKYFNFKLSIYVFTIKIILIIFLTFIIQTFYYYLRWKSFRDFINRIYNLILLQKIYKFRRKI